MKKLVTAVISNGLMVGLPLIGKPLLLFHYKILIIIAGSVVMWLTQPAFSAKETKQKKDSDNFTVLLILSMSFISVLVPVFQWAYFGNTGNEFTMATLGGILMIVTGLIFRAWAVRTLGKYFTPTIQIKDDHALITNGPYNIVRHPSYTGAFLCISGGAVLLETWVGLIICILAMSTAYYFRISLEEEKLTEHFGVNYKNYKARTNRIIPFIW